MSVRERARRFAAVWGIALTQLRRSPARSALAVAAVALATLAVVLLASLGVGVVETGQEGFEESERDLWITGGPVDVGPAGTENPIVDAHDLAADVERREDVRGALPIAMHSAYVGSDPDDLELVTAVGVRDTHHGFEYEAGGGFTRPQSHYAGGSYDGPMSYEVVVDPALADRFDLSVGDTVYVGTSRESAPDHAFTVVGIGSYYSQFLGTPTVTVPIAELQRIAGSAGADRATFVTVNLADDADERAVRDDLREEYSTYDVRTGEGQLEAMVEDRLLLVGSGATLVALAVVGGVALVANLFVLVAYQQRRRLAALGAIGLSRPLLAGTIAVQGFVIGLLGGAVGVLASPPIALGLNRLAAATVGFERVLRTPPEVYALGFAIAVFVGAIAALVAGWRAGRYASVERLEA